MNVSHRLTVTIKIYCELHHAIAMFFTPAGEPKDSFDRCRAFARDVRLFMRTVMKQIHCRK